MTNAIKAVVKNLVRLAILWPIDTILLALASWILPVFSFVAIADTPRGAVIVAAAGSGIHYLDFGYGDCRHFADRHRVYLTGRNVGTAKKIFDRWSIYQDKQ